MVSLSKVEAVTAKMRTFTIIAFSCTAMQASAQLFTPQSALPVAPVAPAARVFAQPSVDALSRRQAMGLAFTLPVGVALTVPQSAQARGQSAATILGVKGTTAQAKDGKRSRLGSKDKISEEGFTPGADSFTTAAARPTSEERSAGGRVASETYKFGGVKRAPVRSGKVGDLGGRVAPSEEELFETSSESADFMQIIAVGMIGFFVGSAGTFALHRFRLAQSTTMQEPLLAVNV